MHHEKVSSGREIPHDINVIIEIPAQSDPIKYEIDKASGGIAVDRFMATCMYYPCNYGYIPNTLSEDGDPVDVLVVTPTRVMSGAIIRCRPVGMLKMTDEAGVDYKILAVPHDKLTPVYSNIKTYEDLPPLLIKQISHFFEHYKDLEAGKWVKVENWEGPESAFKEIEIGVARFKEAK